MADIRSLEQTLLENLPWNRARTKFVVRFLLALYAVKTVNLLILANAFSSIAQIREWAGQKCLGGVREHTTSIVISGTKLRRRIGW